MLHGAPVTTFDLDVVHARDPENIARLLSALEELDGFIVPSRSGSCVPTCRIWQVPAISFC